MNTAGQHYGSIYVLHGHALSASYYDTLDRARIAGRIHFDRLHCIELDPASVLVQAHPEAQIRVTLTDFLIDYNKSAKYSSAKIQNPDLLIPDHTAPHMMMQVLLDWVKIKHPTCHASPIPLSAFPATPFGKSNPEGSVRALSYATWMCPLECDEPHVCPHTGSTRDWDFNTSLSQTMHDLEKSGEKTYRFFARQLVSAIACIPLAEIMTALTDWDDFLEHAGTGTATVATHSHCHGIMGRIAVQPPND